MSRVRGTVHPRNIYEWLAHIQPGIQWVLRRPTAQALQNYIHGYLAALDVNRIREADVPPFDLFLYWLEHRLPGSACAYGWPHVLTEQEGLCQEAALARFFELAAEYGSLNPVLAARRAVPPDHSVSEEYQHANPAHGVPTSLEIYRLEPSSYHFVRYWWGDYPDDSSIHTSLQEAWDSVVWHLGPEIVAMPE